MNHIEPKASMLHEWLRKE